MAENPTLEEVLENEHVPFEFKNGNQQLKDL